MKQYRHEETTIIALCAAVLSVPSDKLSQAIDRLRAALPDGLESQNNRRNIVASSRVPAISQRCGRGISLSSGKTIVMNTLDANPTIGPDQLFKVVKLQKQNRCPKMTTIKAYMKEYQRLNGA
jgi:hypothetical protein